MKELGIIQIQGTPGHSQGRGQVEQKHWLIFLNYFYYLLIYFKVYLATRF